MGGFAAILGIVNAVAVTTPAVTSLIKEIKGKDKQGRRQGERRAMMPVLVKFLMVGAEANGEIVKEVTTGDEPFRAAVAVAFKAATVAKLAAEAAEEAEDGDFWDD